MMEAELTIIVPVYNEADSLHRFEIEMDEYLAKTPMASRILFVDDGSTDDSLRIIADIAGRDDRYSFLSLAENGGLSTALKAGFDQVKTPYTGYIDSDLQTSPMDFILYFPFLPTHTLVNGIRKNRHDSRIKKLSSKIGNSFRRRMIADGIADTCCPLKIMHTDAIKRIPFFTGMHRFIPALIQLYGGNVYQVEVRHFERKEGQSKYRLLNRITGPFLDTLAFVWMRKRIIRYHISSTDISKKSGEVSKAHG